MEIRVIREANECLCWGYFDKITGEDGLPKTRCKICNKVYSQLPDSGTSSMRRHLSKCYPQAITHAVRYADTVMASSSDVLSDENSDDQGSTRSFVWGYFDKITGEDGSPKTRCKICNKVYCHLPKSGTSSMKRHLRKCYPETITQAVPHTDTVMSSSSDEFSNEARAAKRLKSTFVEDVGKKTDRELHEFIWMIKRDVGILEQKFPEKAVAIKEAIKCHEAEIERRARPQRPNENDTGAVPVKVDVNSELLAPYENVGDNVIEDGSAVGSENTETHEDVNQASTLCAELQKVSCVLSMLSSPNKFYIPQGDPLDEEAEKAKQTLIELLNKNFETIVGSPDEERVKSCITILTKNLHKLPRFQGQVIETLNTQFDSACRNWKMSHTNHQSNIAFEVQQGDNFRVLKDWQEKNMEFESKIETLDADVLRLKAQLLEKELTLESLVKQKSDLFDETKMSIDEVKKLLQEMVTAKLQTDVAVDNMNQMGTKWERIRDNFKLKQV